MLVNCGSRVANHQKGNICKDLPEEEKVENGTNHINYRNKLESILFHALSIWWFSEWGLVSGKVWQRGGHKPKGPSIHLREQLQKAILINTLKFFQWYVRRIFLSWICTHVKNVDIYTSDNISHYISQQEILRVFLVAWAENKYEQGRFSSIIHPKWQDPFLSAVPCAIICNRLKGLKTFIRFFYGVLSLLNLAQQFILFYGNQA